MRAARILKCLLPTLLLMVAAQARAGGAQDMLTVRLQPLVAQPRSNAPIWMDIQFELMGPHLVEDRLELVFMDGNEVIGRCGSGEIVLVNGIQRFRMMLPPMSVRGSDAWAEARARFVSDKAVYDLGNHTVSLPHTLERSLVICVSAPRRESNAGYFDIVYSMFLQHFDPQPAAAPARTLSTFASSVPPEGLPIHPLGYCSFDIVFLAGEGFSTLRRKQLDSLSRWVQGGGSVCILPDASLKPYHVQFLNETAGAGGPAFQVEAEGDLRAADGLLHGGIGMFRYGLGRVVVVLMQAGYPPVADSPEWRTAVAFLWKIRKNQLSDFVSRGKWRTDLQTAHRVRDTYSRLRARRDESEPPLALDVLPIGGEDELADRLMPRTIRTMPLGIVVLVMLSFVLAVGPLDYYVLGALKRRRFTWILFPLMCVGFAALTVYLAQYYMGVRDHRRALVLVDIGEGGRVLRWSRCELRFAGKGKQVLTRVKNGLFVQLGETDMVYRSGRGRFGTAQGALPVYQGWMPGNFQVAQRLRQWSPLLCRTFSMEPIEPAIDLDWDAIEASDLADLRHFEKVRKKLPGLRQAEASFYVLHGSEMRQLPGSVSFPDLGRPDARGLLRQICVRPQVGLFSVVSQISPTGADNFEDLSVLDPTDERQWLLIAVVRDGEDYIVYRRLYCGGQ